MISDHCFIVLQTSTITLQTSAITLQTPSPQREECSSFKSFALVSRELTGVDFPPLVHTGANRGFFLHQVPYNNVSSLYASVA